MTRLYPALVLSSLGLALVLALACGRGGSSADTNEVTFGLSDAPVGNLESVTITIESMTLRQSQASKLLEIRPGSSLRPTIPH